MVKFKVNIENTVENFKRIFLDNLTTVVFSSLKHDKNYIFYNKKKINFLIIFILVGTYKLQNNMKIEYIIIFLVKN